MQMYWNKRKRLHRKEFNSHRTGLGDQHGRRFIVLGHQYGRRDVMWKHSIHTSTFFFPFSINSNKGISIDTARKRALKYSNLPRLKVIRGLSGHYERFDRIARFTGPSLTQFAASDVRHVCGVTPALFQPIRSQYSICNNLICRMTGLNVEGETRNITLHFQVVLQQRCKTSCTSLLPILTYL